MTIQLAGPVDGRRKLLPRRAPMPRLLQRGPQSPDNQPAHPRWIAKPDLGLGRVDIDVDLVPRNLDEQRRHRMPVAREQVAIGAAQRPDQQPVFHRAAVDEQILLVGHAAIEGRQADHPGQVQPVANAVDPQPVPLQIVAQQSCDTRRSVAGLQRQDAAPVMIKGEGHVGPRHRQPPYRIEAGGIFRAGRAEELAPRRYLVEQPLDPHPRSWRKRCRPLARRNPMVDRQSPAIRAIPRTAFDRQPRHAGNRRQGLAAKPEACHILDPVVGQFGGRVALDRQPHVVRCHPRSVVADLNQVEPARGQPHRDRPRPGIERILDDFLECARRALDNLARGDSIDQFGGKPSY